MGRVLRMPSEERLPPGPRREFVEALFTYYRSASRPSLRKIAELIPQKCPDVTGSPETVRRTLLGLSTPAKWGTVDSILTVLCDLAQIEPDWPTTAADDPRGVGPTSSPRKEIERLWHRALDADPRAPWGESLEAGQRPRPQSDDAPSGEDLWSTHPELVPGYRHGNEPPLWRESLAAEHRARLQPDDAPWDDDNDPWGDRDCWGDAAPWDAGGLWDREDLSGTYDDEPPV